MSNVISFPNPESMDEYLRRSRQRAKQGLHPVQDRLTFGDHWMQVVDVKDRHVVFGQVHSLDTVAEAEMRAGATYDEARDVLAITRAQLNDGLMYGRAYDRFNPHGELGHTHKVSVWPIDAAVFEAAREVEWVIDALDFPAQVNCQIAWMAHRAWLHEKTRRGL